MLHAAPVEAAAHARHAAGGSRISATSMKCCPLSELQDWARPRTLAGPCRRHERRYTRQRGLPMRSDSVPVIDIADLDRAATRRAIDDACCEWGFFQISNHGIDEALTTALRQQMRAVLRAAPRQQASHSAHRGELVGLLRSRADTSHARLEAGVRLRTAGRRVSRPAVAGRTATVSSGHSGLVRRLRCGRTEAPARARRQSRHARRTRSTRSSVRITRAFCGSTTIRSVRRRYAPRMSPSRAAAIWASIITPTPAR